MFVSIIDILLGKEDSFEQFFRQNYQRMIVYAYTLIKNKEDSLDIVHDAMEYAWNHFHDENINNWQVYIRYYVRTKCIDYFRHKNVQRTYVDLYSHIVDLQKDPEIFEDRERYLAVRKCMESLPPKTRLVMEECYFNEKKYKEVAAEMDITIHAVKKHVVKGLKVLREKFVKKV